jgi:Flp pilus assembly protein TadG
MRTPITDSANVTITVKQGGTAVAGTTVLDASQFDSMAAGTFLVCGVPANPTTEVSAMYMGHQLLAHNVKTVAGDTTATILVPGY